MYERFFKLDQFPFPSAAKPQHYYPGATVELARQTLTRAIERAEGPGLLIGPAGTGKTMLLTVLAEQFQNSLEVVSLSSSRLCSRRALLQAFLYELKLPYRGLEEGELRLSLIDHITGGEHPFGTLVLVDEAHALPIRLLEEIRMITNLVRAGEPRVRLVLAGLPGLEEKFASPKLEAFSQRLAARCYLDRLDVHDTVEYVRTQLAASGGDPDGVFTPEALKAVHRATDGIPRLVNQVCDHAMVLACAGGVRRIDADGIEEAWADLQQLPLPWNATQRPTQDVIEFGTLEDERPPQAGPVYHRADAPSLPFPAGRSTPTFDPTQHLERIEQQLAHIEEDDYEPVQALGPEVELNFTTQISPFGQNFSEEEVVIDRYASLDDEFYRDRQKVRSRIPDSLGPMLQSAIPPARRPVFTIAREDFPADSPAGKPEPLTQPESTSPPLEKAVFPEPSEGFPPAADPVHPEATPVRAAGSDDRDLIIVEDDPVHEVPPPRARRQEYRQLFARLREGK